MSSFKFESRLIWLLVSLTLYPSEQSLWLPHQNVQVPNTWTLPHLLQLKQEYNNLQIKYNCVVQESYVVQDPSAPPSDTDNLLLLPLTSLLFGHYTE